MSLINQMLQDLDARRSDTSGGSTFGQLVRAVPDRRRIHPAWWVALALAGVLTGVLAWVFLRPVPAMAPAQSVRLPLKLDSDLTIAPPAAQSHVAQMQAGQLTTPPAQVADAIKPKEPASSAPVQIPAPPIVDKPQPVLRPEVSAGVAKTSPVGSAPDIAKIVPLPKKPAEAHAVTAPEATVSVPINKQFKELTPQQRAENEYRKAIGLLQQGRTSEATASLEQTLQLDAQHVAARQALIGVLLEGKRQDDALNRAREGINLDPAQPGLAMILARLQLEKGELRGAIETLERTLPFAVDRADYRAFLAALLQRDERHKQAIEHYLVALQRTPQNGIWWMGLGISLQAERRLPEAQEAYRRAKNSGSLSPELQAFVESRLGQLQR